VQQKWRTAVELLMLPVVEVASDGRLTVVGPALSPEVHPVIGGFQCLVAWSGEEVIMAGHVLASAEEAEQDACRMTYDLLLQSAEAFQRSREIPWPTERR
jgi:hypothetical protein